MRVSCLNWFAAGVLVVFAWASHKRALAKDPDTGTTSPGDDAATPAKKPAAKGGRDPCQRIQAPERVTLNSRQKAAYEMLKADKGPELQQAIDDVPKCPGSAVGPAVKKVRECRAEIRQVIDAIVNSGTSQSAEVCGGPGSWRKRYGGIVRLRCSLYGSVRQLRRRISALRLLPARLLSTRPLSRLALSLRFQIGRRIGKILFRRSQRKFEPHAGKRTTSNGKNMPPNRPASGSTSRPSTSGSSGGTSGHK